MANNQDLLEVYQSFCSFGSSRNLAGSSDSLSGPSMDGAKFAKFARDTKILDKTITSIDIDLFFNKVKKDRKLDFGAFQSALKLIAERRSPKMHPAQAYNALVKHICSKQGPKVSGTVPASSSIVDRLTDTSKYTGTHKHRFDADGNGRGILGRDRPNPTADLSQITNREKATLTGVPLSAALQAGAVRTSSIRKAGSPQLKAKRNHDLIKSKDSLISVKK